MNASERSAFAVSRSKVSPRVCWSPRSQVSHSRSARLGRTPRDRARHQAAPGVGRQAEGLDRTLAEDRIAADFQRALQVKPHEPLKGGGFQPAARRLRDFIVDPARDADAEKLGFAFLQRFGLGDLADLVVGELLEPRVALALR